MNDHAAWPPPQPPGTRRRHRHSVEGRSPDRSQRSARHQTRVAGSARPQGRDRGQPSSSHHQRTPIRPEENPSSRAGSGTNYATAGRGGATPGGRIEPPGQDQSWGGASSCAASDGSAQRPRRNPLRAFAAAFIALFRTKKGLKHAETRAITAGPGRQAAAVSPIPTAAAAAAADRSRRSSAADSTRGSPYHRRTSARPVASPIPEDAATPDWSPRSYAADSTRGLQHQRRRTSSSAVSSMPETVSESSGSERSYYTRDSTRGSPYPGWSTGSALTMNEILYATDNFSPACRIGKGEFGSVYRGVLRDGKVVAIKRARKDSGNHSMDPEFQSEISILPHVTHLNLVRMLCYVEGRGERVIVVEHVPNGTLREHLDGLYGNTLDFLARLSNAVDIAHAITYLHGYADHPIIHRDIKASNILLTQNLRAKVGDFGFARLGPPEGSYVVTKIKGTTGYLDPEYLKTQQLSDKSDVYAFGVLMVELLSGRRPIERRRRLVERVTADWAMEKFQCGQASEVLDPNIPNSPAANLALERMLELASQCLAPTKHARPTMKNCGKILMGIRKEYMEFSHDNAPQQELLER